MVWLPLLLLCVFILPTQFHWWVLCDRGRKNRRWGSPEYSDKLLHTITSAIQKSEWNIKDRSDEDHRWKEQILKYLGSQTQTKDRNSICVLLCSCKVQACWVLHWIGSGFKFDNKSRISVAEHLYSWWGLFIFVCVLGCSEWKWDEMRREEGRQNEIDKSEQMARCPGTFMWMMECSFEAIRY